LRAYPQQYFKPGAVAKNNIFISERDNFTIYKPASWPKAMNLSKVGSKKMPYEFDFDNNVYWHKTAAEFLEVQKKEGIEANTIVADPLFYDVEKGDFRLKKKSPALKLGFVPFDTDSNSFGVTEDYPDKFEKLDKEALKQVDLEAYNKKLHEILSH